ncbi:FadR/GntR family transcriptional regulator [Shimia thalassica]|uniref:FadR/GntR family transcriptional regulator n=1 Tax=Shimia thalassica TaxID=1715693 RepID=UPI0026E1D918|nr:FadR/GntR family transcriptional regulator [Shimia thalassica]MDO6485516.1 FadR/GntR family transcriptional regulator [Shimia thalassica]MDO6799112.1 FadR/GntR family transcriptional regulator [Shimia thalassica]
MSDTSPFDPVGHESLAEAVVEQIETMIVDGILKEGRKLPSERELAEALGVSRPKLREALQILESEGLVNVRHGEGTFIATLTGRAMSPALLALYARHGRAFYDYLEYRREQEAFACRLAAARATQSDKERLMEIIGEMNKAFDENDSEASQEADLKLHAAVVDASQNTTLIHMMASVYDLTRQGVFYNRAFLRTMDGTGKKLLAQHREIVDAIVAGNPDRADAAARNHMDFVETSFRLGQEQRDREDRAAKRRKLSM